MCLKRAFAETSVVDRRKTPSHGYRAVHVIARLHGMPVEVQIRTELEHHWAQLSEKLSDIVDPSVKYGGGPEPLRSMLLDVSETVGQIEVAEHSLLALKARPDSREPIARIAAEFAEEKRQFKDLLKRMIEQSHLWQDQ